MKKTAPMCITVKLLRTKDQEKILKAARTKQHITNNDSNSNGLFPETMLEDSRKTSPNCWGNNHCQPRILRSIKIFFKNEGKIKMFSDKRGSLSHAHKPLFMLFPLSGTVCPPVFSLLTPIHPSHLSLHATSSWKPS